MTLQAAVGQTAPILLIEDEPSVIAFLKAALERKGYTVVNASSGAEGLKQLAGGQLWRSDFRHSNAGRCERRGSTRLDSKEPAGAWIEDHSHQRRHS